jgi:hypothetical protein
MTPAAPRRRATAIRRALPSRLGGSASLSTQAAHRTGTPEGGEGWLRE